MIKAGTNVLVQVVVVKIRPQQYTPSNPLIQVDINSKFSQENY